MKYLIIFIFISINLTSKCQFYIPEDYLNFDLKAINKAKNKDKIIDGFYYDKNGN